MSGKQIQHLIDEIEQRNELISTMERKEEVMKGRIDSYRKLACSDSPRREIDLEEELDKVERELKSAMIDYNNTKNNESESSTMSIIESLLGNGGLRQALDGKQVSHSKATRIADKIIQHYRENTPDPSSIVPIMELLAREGLAAHITTSDSSNINHSRSLEIESSEDPFAWFADTQNLNHTPGSIANRLRQVHLKCDELLKVFEAQ